MLGWPGARARSTRRTDPQSEAIRVPGGIGVLLVSRRWSGSRPGATVSTTATTARSAATAVRGRRARRAPVTSAPQAITTTANITVAAAPSELIT